MVLSFASSERSTRPREGLSGGISIPQMINPLLEGFDPARRPLLFSCGILACCARARVRVAAQLPKSGYFGIGNLRALRLNWRKQLRKLVEYHDTASTTPFLVSAVSRGRCGAVRRDSAFRHGRKLDGAPSPGARP